MQATITSKGQITIPKRVRDTLHLKAGDRIEFIESEAEGYRVVPVTASIKQLKGMTPRPGKPVTLAEMDAAIALGAST